jgi:hypothetical protein
MKQIGIIFSTLIFITSASADFGTYKLEIERDGVTYLQVAMNEWQGEYPGPVIDVSSKKKNKTTTVKGWESLRKQTVQKNCTITNGLYHPWSQTKNSVIDFYTIAPVLDYVVLQDIANPQDLDISSLNGDQSVPAIKAGSKIVNYMYLAEGGAMATLQQDGVEQYLYLFYDTLEKPEYFAEIPASKASKKVTEEDGTISDAYEQWLYVKCAEGYKVFIEDTALLSQKGVKEGNITGYGEIEGAK